MLTLTQDVCPGLEWHQARLLPRLGIPSEPQAQRVSSLYLVYVDTRHPLTGDDSLAGQLIDDVRYIEVLCQVRVAADELLEALLASCLVLIVTLHGQLTLGHLHMTHTHSNTSTYVKRR